MDDIGDATVGVPRGCTHLDLVPADAHDVATDHRPTGARGPGRFRLQGLCAQALAQQSGSGDVVGLDVSLNHKVPATDRAQQTTTSWAAGSPSGEGPKPERPCRRMMPQPGTLTSRSTGVQQVGESLGRWRPLLWRPLLWRPLLWRLLLWRPLLWRPLLWRPLLWRLLLWRPRLWHRRWILRLYQRRWTRR